MDFSDIIDPCNSIQGQTMNIRTWSHTRLQKFESCKFAAKLAYIDRIPEPPRALKPGQTELPNDRGTRIHNAAEMFIKGGVELIPELSKFQLEFERAREMFAEGKASTEGDWGYTKDWEPVAWMSSDVWCRIKCDLVCYMSPKWAVVVDYKSGKRFGNEVKHSEQMQLYTIGTLLRFPKLEKVTTELWYVDQNELASITYNREQGLRLIPRFEGRANLMTACEEFTPNPSVFSCRWCPYKPESLGGTGHCSVGI